MLREFEMPPEKKLLLPAAADTKDLPIFSSVL
jgi:hypothetical protein